ncbi:uncharacterized protein B0H18DRAFT_629131 [Fomitopsis serialis]|uniref:uncharacterized protein n=1 Tax=Fomitopsis serialis TaxID=139415 RepID=UPI002007BEC1|nr:uncharacterized protein B0H18DRAFT_629131 [Neoantrodia serialis]KAH9919598.1 hypothetical protein B0H18DRAFT_629131 [Neoantrodia serialis]
MENDSASSSNPAPRGRGRGKSRGGLGKYLRARGRGRGGGRPAQFGQRLVLEGEMPEELDEEEAAEMQKRYARRQLGTNADRYKELEPELDSEGEEILEPEVDLSTFLERQRLSPQESSAPPPPEDDPEIDASVANILPGRQGAAAQSKKGKVQQVEWDESLEELSREKAAAEAKWDLKSRFRASAAKQRGAPATTSRCMGRGRQHVAICADRVVEAPPLPTEQKPQKSGKEDMEDFLDDLLG